MKGIVFAVAVVFLLLPDSAWAVDGRIEDGWSYVWAAYGISWAALLAYIYRLHKQGGL